MSATDPLRDVPTFDIVRRDRGSVSSLVFRTFATVDDIVRWLGAMAMRDAWDESSGIPALSRSLRRTDPIDTLRSIHDFVYEHVTYELDIFEGVEQQRLETPRYVLAHQRGDCERMAVLQASLVAAVGGSFRFPLMNGTREAPEHVSLLVAPVGLMPHEPPKWAAARDYPDVAGWIWSETTIAARFGEHPWVAEQRLRVA